MKKSAGILAGLLALMVAAPAAMAKDVELKIATLAPKGSAWAKIMEKGAADIAKATSNRVTIKYFFSGQQGDERDVVRKMTGGQLDGAALTAVGLGLIVPQIRVMELPFLFKNDKQLDHVRAKMGDEFSALFTKAGYTWIANGDVGWVHIYSNIDIQSKADLGKTKMWAWTDDPIVRELFKNLGINGVPLGVPDVLPSLQTGLIDACYGSPLAAVALQWYTKVKFATSQPISYSIGALVIRKDVFDSLSADDQKAVLAGGATMGASLLATVRKDNEKAKKAMQGAGVKFTNTPAALVSDFETNSKAVWKAMAGKLYDQALLDKVIKFRDEVK
jgi:TRAP-type C4-dicarboxylate transport system substrate-binding protein